MSNKLTENDHIEFNTSISNKNDNDDNKNIEEMVKNHATRRSTRGRNAGLVWSKELVTGKGKALLVPTIPGKKAVHDVSEELEVVKKVKKVYTAQSKLSSFNTPRSSQKNVQLRTTLTSSTKSPEKVKKLIDQLNHLLKEL